MISIPNYMEYIMYFATCRMRIKEPQIKSVAFLFPSQTSSKRHSSINSCIPLTSSILCKHYSNYYQTHRLLNSNISFQNLVSFIVWLVNTSLILCVKSFSIGINRLMAVNFFLLHKPVGLFDRMNGCICGPFSFVIDLKD